MKAEYDRRHRANSPDFEIGQYVLLTDVRIAPRSNKVLTKRPCSLHSYIIKQVINSYGAGPAYKLTDPNTAKDSCGLIAHDRLKHFNVPKKPVENATALSAKVAVKPCFKPADKILKRQYYRRKGFKKPRTEMATQIVDRRRTIAGIPAEKNQTSASKLVSKFVLLLPLLS